ncbi:MAG: hypothetical protein IJ437_06475 [Clostridia bacterium]|nr:hypothetical protein [Clostridia bacterium]
MPIYAFATLIDTESKYVGSEETTGEVVVLEEDVSLREENKMKKIIVLLLLISLLILCSCDNNTDTDTETSTDSDTSTEVVDSSTDTSTDTDNSSDTETEATGSSIDTENVESDTESGTETETNSESDTNTENDVDLISKGEAILIASTHYYYFYSPESPSTPSHVISPKCINPLATEENPNYWYILIREVCNGHDTSTCDMKGGGILYVIDKYSGSIVDIVGKE